MILMIQEFGWAGLVNELDVLPMVQRSTVSGYPCEMAADGADGTITQGQH